jgi:hypothetical protein
LLILLPTFLPHSFESKVGLLNNKHCITLKLMLLRTVRNKQFAVGVLFLLRSLEPFVFSNVCTDL